MASKSATALKSLRMADPPIEPGFEDFGARPVDARVIGAPAAVVRILAAFVSLDDPIHRRAMPNVCQTARLNVADDQLGVDIPARAGVDASVDEHDRFHEEQLAGSALERHFSWLETDR